MEGLVTIMSRRFGRLGPNETAPQKCDVNPRSRCRPCTPLGIGTMHAMRSHITGVFLRSFATRGYTLPEKVNLWRAKARSGVSPFWKAMISTDLSETLPEVTVPIYFLQGIYDYTCTYSVALEYFEVLKAPL